MTLSPPHVIQQLEAALSSKFGPEGLSRAPEVLSDYAADESHSPPAAPQLVFRPESEEQVSCALALCSELNVPVTPCGARTGKSGGCIPASGGLALGMDRMDRILEISPADMTAVVEPGVLTGKLMAAAELQGLFYPPDPASLRECTIGGNIAENAGGPRAFKYGVTRDYVLGLRAVLMDGSILTTGHKSVKGVAGYDLTGLLVGSEGTLGVVTQATLLLLPLPRAAAAALLTFRSLDAAADAVTAILLGGALPRTLELMDGTALRSVDGQGVHFPPDAEAALLVELDGDDERQLAEQLEGLAAHLPEAGCAPASMETARTSEARERLWEARRGVSRALRSRARFKASEDIAVPRSQIPGVIRRIKAIGRERGIGTAVYGHAGDGNLHVNFLYDEPSQQSAVEGAIEALMCAALDVGGTITGEHGVGLTKRAFLPREIGEAGIGLHRRLKAVFDPRGLLNPGKIF